MKVVQQHEWTQKVNNNPKIKSKSNVRIEGNKENEKNCTIWVDPKTIRTWPQPSK